MFKRCSKCKLEKDVELDFNKNKSKNDGFATECKQCKRIQDTKYREANKEYFRKYRQDNKIELADKKCKYVEENKIAHLKRQHIWYEKHKEDIRARISQYKKDHPEQYQMYANKRMASKKTLILEKIKYKDIIIKYGDKCFYCNGNFEHIDHYIPLSKGGSHTLDNIRPSCEICNLTKSNKMPEEFVKYKEELNE